MSFKSSAIRHYEDGNTLFDNRRFDNADQLFGFATECAIKACLPKKCFIGSKLDDYYRVHIDKLWSHAITSINSKAFPGLPTVLSKLRPFDNWKTDNRYEMTGTITEVICQEHRGGAKRVLHAARLLGERKR